MPTQSVLDARFRGGEPMETDEALDLIEEILENIDLGVINPVDGLDRMRQVIDYQEDPGAGTDEGITADDLQGLKQILQADDPELNTVVFETGIGPCPCEYCQQENTSAHS